MTSGINGIARTSVRMPTGDAAAAPAPTGRATPSLDGLVPEGMGIEYLAAMLMTETAKETKKTMRELQHEAKATQVASLREQAHHLREKADDLEAEGWLAGAMTAAGGALTIGAAYAGPSASDTAKAGEWNAAAKTYGGGFKDVAASCNATLQAQTRLASTLSSLGSTTAALGPQLSKATYGAAQVRDDAEATRAAADAKFAETAKDEYAALVRDFDAGASKAMQLLQSITAERQATRRGILQKI